MSKGIPNNLYNTHMFHCPHCDKRFSGQGWAYVNTVEKPSLKEQVLSGKLFTTRCPYCRKNSQQEYEFLYVDQVNKALIALQFKPLLVYTDNFFLSKFKFLPPHIAEYKRRVVPRFQNLSEKALIYDYGLDDRVVQFLKDMIGYDYQKKGKKAPSEITFFGLNTNFKQTELNFKLISDKIAVSESWDETHYKFCSNLIEKYTEDFQNTGWLVINEYFPKHFMELAYEKFKKNEFELLMPKGESLRKQLSILSRIRMNPRLVGFINASHVTLSDSTLYWDFPSEILVSKAKVLCVQLASVAEEVIGFKPDIVCRLKNAKKAS